MPLAFPPLHPLMVHGAVVFIPLFALAAIAYAVVPRWRWALRWPMFVTNLLSFAFLWVSRITGDSLAHATPDNKDLIERHDQLAGLLTIGMVPLFVLGVAAFLALPVASPTADGRWGREARWGALGVAVRWLLLLLAIFVLVMVVLTGDAGARAAWA